MEFELQKTISILERTPAVLRTYLQGLSEDWTHQNEGKDTWSPYDIVGHLIHGEKTDWVIRTKIFLSNMDHKEFEPFDRFAQFEDSKGKTLDQLLDEFEDLRNKNIAELKSFNISNDNLLLEAMHPGLGKVNLKQLLSAWTVHDLGHIYQISRVMAKQYKANVGPWTDYLAVLD